MEIQNEIVVDCHFNARSNTCVVVVLACLVVLVLYVQSDGSVARWRFDCGSCVSVNLSEWIPLPWVAHQHATSPLPSSHYCAPHHPPTALVPLSLTTAPLPSLPHLVLLVY